MKPRKPVIGGKYRHSKNKIYQLLAVATHNETAEKYIVYQALYDDFRVYIRPYDMLLSEVDHFTFPLVYI
ncbi:DUF1653 domain-containing protein [Desulfosporosinus sp. PR]|uniref:DUF1653 domain-containing protein n=1 Tax=Candidatus Desulfosporosinus nitrosoreducens TaxID=3401928 RepID=UPI0027F2E908|nr:DUF1653 domain-containing protein [Desulfosporosinus sp. PR]MDQ7096682.1 DUF1653 domain-containing protein [Desulfosporosinus sp. PR]